MGAMLLLLCVLAACGGGGGGGEARCIPGVATMAFPQGCPGDNLGSAATATIGIGLVDPDSRAAITAVSPSQAGELRVTVKNAAGAAVPRVAVTFLTSDSSGGFVPSSGTALTDDNGVAAVRLPAGARAGAFTVTASATVAGAAVKTSLDYGVGFPTLALGPIMVAPDRPLSAGGNAAVTVEVQSNGAAYAPPLPVSFTSPCIAAGKATMGKSVLTQKGLAKTSYTDKGCGVRDEITASVTLGDVTVTRRGVIDVQPASVGSIKFVSANTTNIALKGTGGFGRQEFSTLKFEVYDSTGARLPGALVNFRFADSNASTTVGGLMLNPAEATTDGEGAVTTQVAGGLVPTSVRVLASIGADPGAVTTLSNILVVSTGVPVQKRFSLSSSAGNCEGWDIDQVCSTVTATVGDQFGNPVPDGTAVSFITEAGLIGASCVTGSLPEPGATPVGQTTNSAIGPGSGSCSVLLRSGGMRTHDGRVTVLAYLLGEEDFFDANGNNRYDPGETHTDLPTAVFRDDNESFDWTTGEPCIGPTRTPSCTATGDGIYNGVLGQPFGAATPSNVYIAAQLVQTFSGSRAVITFDPGSGACPGSGQRDGRLRIADINDNLMPAGTQIFISRGPVFQDPPIARVPNVVLAVDQQRPMGPYIPVYTVPASCTQSSMLFVKVVTPAQEETVTSFQINP